MGFMDGVRLAQENKQKRKEAIEKSADIVDKDEIFLADALYKNYVIDGASRLDKVNGRLLASINLKLDAVAEQNDRIIELLEIISNK